MKVLFVVMFAHLMAMPLWAQYQFERLCSSNEISMLIADMPKYNSYCIIGEEILNDYKVLNPLLKTFSTKGVNTIFCDISKTDEWVINKYFVEKKHIQPKLKKEVLNRYSALIKCRSDSLKIIGVQPEDDLSKPILALTSILYKNEYFLLGNKLLTEYNKICGPFSATDSTEIRVVYNEISNIINSNKFNFSDPLDSIYFQEIFESFSDRYSTLFLDYGSEKYLLHKADYSKRIIEKSCLNKSSFVYICSRNNIAVASMSPGELFNISNYSRCLIYYISDRKNSLMYYQIPFKEKSKISSLSKKSIILKNVDLSLIPYNFVILK